MGDARPVLMQLIEEKLLTPGSKKLYVSYYRKRVYADLLSDGSIRFKDTIYISPVPCALQMKRTLNPSLKTDAGWSTMFSAASGESLKDIKDRLNIRKRGPNSRTVNKDKKLVQAAAGGAVSLGKERSSGSGGSTTTASTANNGDAAKLLASTLQRCNSCKKDALADYTTCSACKQRTHLQCANPVLDKAPSGSWFCDACLTDQANQILDFLKQTQRVLASHTGVETVPVRDEDTQLTTDAELSASEVENEPDQTDDANDAPASSSNVEERDEEDDDKADAEKADAEKADPEAEMAESQNGDAQKAPSSPVTSVNDISDGAPVVISSAKRLTPIERFSSLLAQLVEEVASKSERTDIITNSTGATLVHLAKTDLVNLVERGLSEIELAAVKPGDDDEVEAMDADQVKESDSDVTHLIRLFDLRHQVIQSKQQFDHTTSALVQRGEQRLRVAETELMGLEETRTSESNAVTKIANLIDQYTSDLKNCQERIRLNHVLLESITQRRKLIRSTNVSKVFVPSYRLVAKHMITSSDQLLTTVMLDKLRDIARMVNEWEKMEKHFETMSSKLLDQLDIMKVKPERNDGVTPAPKPLPLFARIKIPPSRRLIERQIANYGTNMKAIAANRLRVQKTLQTTLKIAKEEMLDEKVVETTEILLRKCGGPIVEQEEETIEKHDELVDVEGEVDVIPSEDIVTVEKRSREGEDEEAQDAKRQRTDSEQTNVVKPEPSSASVPPASTALPSPHSTPANGPSSSSAIPIAQVVDVVDSDESDSNSTPSPVVVDRSVEASNPSNVAKSNIHSVESIQVKQELVEQATRHDVVPSAFHSSTSQPATVRKDQPYPSTQRIDAVSATLSTDARKAASTGVQAPPQQAQWPGASTSRNPTEQSFAQQAQSSYQGIQQPQPQQQVPAPANPSNRPQQPKPVAAPSRQPPPQQPVFPQAGARYSAQTQDQPQVAQQQQSKARRDVDQSRQNQRQQLQARDDSARQTSEQVMHGFHPQQSLPSHHDRSQQQQQQQPQSLRPAHHISPVREPFPQVRSANPIRPPTTQQTVGFSALGDAHEPVEFGGHQRHQMSMASTAVDVQSQHNFQQQQFQRFQQQQQQHVGQRGGVASNAGGNIFGDLMKPSANATTQDLFGNHGHHTQQHATDDALGLGQPGRGQANTQRAQPQAQQQQQQQHQFQQQHQMLHHPHHLNPAATTNLAQHHPQAHPLGPGAGSMNPQFSDPSAMRSAFMPSSNQVRPPAFGFGDNQNHMMHHPHGDVFGSHGLGGAHSQQQQQQHPGQQQAPSIHNLFQNDVTGRSNPADFHFNNRLFRDPNTDNQMNHSGLPSPPPDMSEW